MRGRRPVAVVRIRVSDLCMEWGKAVADLLTAIEHADPIMVEGDVRDAADRLRRVLYAAAREDD